MVYQLRVCLLLINAAGLPLSGLALLLARIHLVTSYQFSYTRTLKFNWWTSCWRIYSGWSAIKWRINTNAFGAISSNRAPNDGVTHVSSGYRQYPNVTRSHWGADISAEYYYNENLSFWANYSHISQNEWIPGEANDDDLPFPSYLNTPLNKCRAGIRFYFDDVRASLAYQYDEAFFSNFGAGLGGDAPERHTFDGNIGFEIMDGVFFDIQLQIYWIEYRQYPGLPIIGEESYLKQLLILELTNSKKSILLDAFFVCNFNLFNRYLNKIDI